ncbi:MAG: hypothetical protein NC223_06590 [Butyrivibrio sp.]|nr:hypothetical protein [Butyrivibrio sp.]
MKKAMKKVLAAVLAATMVIGMMAVSALADDVYRVAGAAGLCNGDEWDTTKNEMTANGDGTYSITFEGVAAGTYGFKVLKGDAWGDAYNLEGAANGMGDDASVEVAEDNSKVVISFDGEKASVVVNPADEGTDTPTGDASHAALYVVIAAAAAAVLVIAGKKRTVEE